MIPLSHDERRRRGGPEQLRVGQLVGEHVEHHLQLEAGEVGPDAVVRAAAAEGDVGIRRAADVEARRVVEDLLVEVGGGEVQADPLPLAHRLAAHLGVLERGALEDHGGRGPAQDLVDRRRRPLEPPALPLVRMLQERQHAVGDRLPGGLVARHGQDHEEEGELLAAQALAVGVRLDEPAGDVPEIVGDPCLGRRMGVGEHLDDTRQVGVGVLRVLAARHLIAPVEELLAILVGDAHEARDGLQGQMAGDVHHEVARAFCLADHTIRCARSRSSSSSPARARGVKHRFPTLRTRVCRGGSMQSRRFLVDSPVGSDSSKRRTKAELASTDHSSPLVTAVTSAWRVNAQNPASP